MARARLTVSNPAALAGGTGVLAWALGRSFLAGAWGLPWLDAGGLVFLALVGAGVWALLGGDRRLSGWAVARWTGAGIALALGEALLYYRVEGKERFAGLGFGAMAAGALFIWPRASAPGRWAALAGALAMALAAGLSGRDLYFDLYMGPWHAPLAAGLFWAGFALALGGLALGAAGQRPPALAEPRLAPAREAVLLALVLVAAAALRFIHPAGLPAGYWLDEVTFGQTAVDQVLGLGRVPLYSGEQAGAYLWVSAALFKGWGVDLRVLRIASGVFGLLALLPFWALARMWVGRRWALAATLALGVMRWVAIPQRIAFLSSFALFWMLAAFWALWNAQLRGPGRGGWRWLLAGLLLGANLHTYTPARAVPLVCLAFLLLQARLDPAWRRSGRDWLGLGLGFALSGGPMLAFMARHWQEYSARPDQASIFGAVKLSGVPLAEALWGNLTRHVCMFQLRGDFNARHNLSGYPQVDFILACALAPALPWTLGRAWRDARGRFLWLWLAAMLLAGILSLPSEAPQANRCILAAPAVALAAAWALRELSAPLGRALGGWPGPALAAGLALLLGMALINGVELLGRWPQEGSTYLRFCPRGNAVMRRVEASPPGTAVYVSGLDQEPVYNGKEVTAFATFGLAEQKRACNRLGPAQALITENGSAKPLAALLVWGESDAEIRQAFIHEFPGLPVEKPPFAYAGPGDPDELYEAALVPAERIPRWDGRGAPPFLFRLY